MTDTDPALRDALDNLVRSAQGRCSYSLCPSRHVGDAADCIAAALDRAALAAASPPPLDVDAVYRAVRPEYRDDGPGADRGGSDIRAHATAERIYARLAAASPPPLDVAAFHRRAEDICDDMDAAGLDEWTERWRTAWRESFYAADEAEP